MKENLTRISCVLDFFCFFGSLLYILFSVLMLLTIHTSPFSSLTHKQYVTHNPLIPVILKRKKNASLIELVEDKHQILFHDPFLLNTKEDQVIARASGREGIP